MTAAEIIQALADFSRRIEEHESASWVLRWQQDELRAQLRAMTWTPPPALKALL
jgi:hypothetical protein